MAKASSMALSPKEIEAMEAQMVGGADPASADDGGAAKAPDEIEYVGPDEDAAPDADAPDKAAAPATPTTIPSDKKPAAVAGTGDKGKHGAGDRKPPEGFVPLSALQDERIQSRERQARLEERLNHLQESIQRAVQQPQRPAEPEAPPAWADDPEAAHAYLANRVERLVTWLGERSRAEKSQSDESSQWNHVLQQVGGYWQRAVEADPQINDAYQTLRQSYANELHALGYSGPKLKNELDRIEAQHIMNAYTNQTPIDQMVVSLARARAGWKPRAEGAENVEKTDTEVALPSTGKTAGNGAAEVQRLAKAAEAAETLTAAGGAAPGNTKMSLETLDRMSKAEIDNWVKQMVKKGDGALDTALAKMMGVR